MGVLYGSLREMIALQPQIATEDVIFFLEMDHKIYRWQMGTVLKQD